MATFAVFYNRVDLTLLAAALKNAALSPAQRVLANAFWNDGVKNWGTAPFSSRPEDNDRDTRVLVVTGRNHTLADLITLLRDVGSTVTGAGYMLALVSDLIVSGAVEPWP